MKKANPVFEPLIKNVEKVINEALQLDQHTLHGLTQLAGNVFQIKVAEIDLDLFLLPDENGLRISLEKQEKIDVVIKGRPLALMGLVINKKTGAAVLPKELEIKGDINLAQQLQTVMRGLDLDWEEYLSQWIGDTAAHQFGNLLRNTGRFLKQAGSSLRQNTSDYLRFEKEILPDQLLMDEFVQAVDDLRNDVDRLEQRIQRLQKT